MRNNAPEGTYVLEYDFDCAVIGAGPGGLVAALYLKRFRRSVLLIGEDSPRAAMIPKIRNLIGYAEGISGKELLRRITRQTQAHGIKILRARAELRKTGAGFTVITPTRKYRVKKAILATGMKDLEPPIANFKEVCAKSKLAYCPICDVYDHRGEDIGILVRSPECLGKIKFLARFSDRLHVIRTRPFRWPKSARDYFHGNGVRTPRGYLLKMNLRGGQLEVEMKGCPSPLRLDFAYVALGTHVPSRAFARIKGLNKTRDGFLRTSKKQMTSVPGLYAVGDCADSLSQISVAIGHAAIAATHIHNELLKKWDTR